MADLSDEKLMDIFELFDKNGDGYIDEKEAISMFDQMGFDYSKLEVQLTTLFL